MPPHIFVPKPSGTRFNRFNRYNRFNRDITGDLNALEVAVLFLIVDLVLKVYIGFEVDV